MQFEKITAHGGTSYRCLLFDNVTVAASDYLDSEAFPMPASKGEHALHITAISDGGTARFVGSGSNTPGDDDVIVVSGMSDIATGRTAALGPSLHTFTLTGVAYPRIRLVNTSALEPITVTVHLSITAVEGNIDPTDYTSHIACSDVQRQVAHRYKGNVSEQRLIDVINELMRDIGLKTKYFRGTREIALSTSQDKYKISDDLRMIEQVYDADGALLYPITMEAAARESSGPWWELQGTVDRFMVDGVAPGSIRPYPLPDNETQTLTVRYVEVPSPINYLTEYIPIHRMFMKVVIDYIVAQLYADENDAIDLQKERYRMLSYFSGRNEIVSQAAGNAQGNHEMSYRGI